MKAKSIYHLVVLGIVILFVISAKDEFINALFSIFVGGWIMAKLYNRIFKSVKDSEHFTLDRFFSGNFMTETLVYLLFGPERKISFLVLAWWVAGILSAILTYKALNLLSIA